mgnify:FL=1
MFFGVEVLSHGYIVSVLFGAIEENDPSLVVEEIADAVFEFVGFHVEFSDFAHEFDGCFADEWVPDVPVHIEEGAAGEAFYVKESF